MSPPIDIICLKYVNEDVKQILFKNIKYEYVITHGRSWEWFEKGYTKETG